MKRIVKSLMLIVIASILVTSCDEQKKGLKDLVEKFNNECPIPLGDIGSINSVLYDGESIEMKFISYETFAPISTLSSHQQEVKEVLCLSLSSESGKDLIDKVISTGSIFKMVFIGNQSMQKAEFTISAQELRNAQDKYSNMSDQQKLIITNVLGTKIKLPIAIDNTTKLVGLSLTQDELIYKFEVNDREAGEGLATSVNFVKAIAMSQMAHSLKGGMMGDRNKRFYQALVKNNQGVKYEYYEINTRNSTSFKISPNEINEVLNGEWDNLPTSTEIEDLSNSLDELMEEYDEDSTRIEVIY